MIQRYDLAPLDGITKVVFRRVWNRHFGGADRCFIPFFSPTDHHVVTARDSSGSLQGYAAFTLTDCPHCPGKRLAALDGLYLAPAARKGLAVLKLLRAAEAGLRERGADVVQYSSPASRPCDALYRRLGARHTESVWHKELR